MIFLYYLILFLLTFILSYVILLAKGDDSLASIDLSSITVTEVYTVATLYNEKSSKGHRNGREHSSIGIKFSGETVYSSQGKKFVCDISNVIYLPKGSVYDWICTSSGHYRFIEFDTDNPSTDIFSIPVQDGSAITRALKELQKATGRLDKMQKLYALLFMLSSQKDSSAPLIKQRKIKPALDEIEQHYYRPQSNDALAVLCGISTVYFRKLFTEVTGYSPIDYLHVFRISRAKDLLKSDYGTLSDVAQSVGYPNVYHFSKTFKKIAGIAPGQYAKK